MEDDLMLGYARIGQRIYYNPKELGQGLLKLNT
jgi:hypothetical protein